MGTLQTTTRLATFRIAIVEDNDDVREMLRMLLTLGGHEVSVAEDGEQGLGMIRHERPEVALIDIELPKVDGYELARALRCDATTQPLFLVALTGHGQPGDRQRALDAGFNAHLEKPLLREDLAEVLRQAAG